MDDINSYDENGYTKLLKAIEENDIDNINTLLKNGADINLPKKKSSKKMFSDGFTPLHLACYKNNLEIIKLLLGNGANVELRNEDGYTSLHVACTSKNFDTIKLLLDNGADVNAINQYGQRPLHISCVGPYPEMPKIIKLLLDHGANVNQTDENGATPLTIIATSYDLESLNLLLESGADPNVKDRVFGSTPLHYLVACAITNPVPDEITQMIFSLLNHGANENLPNNMGISPLSHLEFTNPEYHKLLMEKYKKDGVSGGKRKTKKINKKSKKSKKVKKNKKLRKKTKKTKKKLIN